MLDDRSETRDVLPHAPARSKARKDTGIRERLLESAFREFAKHGYRGASLRRLCERADASIGNVGHLFGGKHGLLQAVEDDVAAPLFQERLASLDNLLENEPNPTAAQVFDASIGPSKRFFLEPELGALRARYFLWHALEHEAFWPLAKRGGEEFWARCLDAYRRALPGVSDDELLYRMNAAHRFFGNSITPLMQNADEPTGPSPAELARIRRWCISILVDPFQDREDELDRATPDA